jgi:hypothetical protein
VSLAPGCKLAEVIASTFRCNVPALFAKDSGCWHLGLRQEIIGNRQSRTEQFPASCRAVLWEWGCGQDQVGFRYQFLERGELVSIGCHAPKIRQGIPESKRLLFARNTLIRHYPRTLVKDAYIASEDFGRKRTGPQEAFGDVCGFHRSQMGEMERGQ